MQFILCNICVMCLMSLSYILGQETDKNVLPRGGVGAGGRGLYTTGCVTPASLSYYLPFDKCPFFIFNPNQSGIPPDSKGVACWSFNTNYPMLHAFGTVKNGKNASLWELGWGTQRTQISVENLPIVVHCMLDLDLNTEVNPFKTWP